MALVRIEKRMKSVQDLRPSDCAVPDQVLRLWQGFSTIEQTVFGGQLLRLFLMYRRNGAREWLH